MKKIYSILFFFFAVLAGISFSGVVDAAGTCCVYMEGEVSFGDGGDPLDYGNCMKSDGSEVGTPDTDWNCPAGSFPDQMVGAYYVYGQTGSGPCGNIDGYTLLQKSKTDSYCTQGISNLRDLPNSDPFHGKVKLVMDGKYTTYYTGVSESSCCLPIDKTGENGNLKCHLPQVRKNAYLSIVNYFFDPVIGPSLNPPSDSVSVHMYCGSKENEPGSTGSDESLYALLPGAKCLSQDTLNQQYVPTFYKVKFPANVYTLFSLCEGSLSAAVPVSTAPPASAAKPKLDIDSFLKERYPVPEGYTGPLPACAFHGTCDDVNDLLKLAINVGKWIFGFLGTFALAMFVYGGFVWVTSGGNPERVKKGRDIVVAAVAGLIIAFGAYILINFLLDALTVKDAFRGIT